MPICPNCNNQRTKLCAGGICKQCRDNKQSSSPGNFNPTNMSFNNTYSSQESNGYQNSFPSNVPFDSSSSNYNSNYATIQHINPPLGSGTRPRIPNNMNNIIGVNQIPLQTTNVQVNSDTNGNAVSQNGGPQQPPFDMNKPVN